MIFADVMHNMPPCRHWRCRWCGRSPSRRTRRCRLGSSPFAAPPCCRWAYFLLRAIQINIPGGQQYQNVRVKIDLYQTVGSDSLCRPVDIVMGRAKKTLPSSVTHVASGLMGRVLAASSWWLGGRLVIQTCKIYFAPPCSPPQECYFVQPPTKSTASNKEYAPLQHGRTYSLSASMNNTRRVWFWIGLKSEKPYVQCNMQAIGVNWKLFVFSFTCYIVA